MNKRVKTNFILAMIPTAVLGLVVLLALLAVVAVIIFDEQILGYLHFLGGLLLILEFFPAEHRNVNLDYDTLILITISIEKSPPFNSVVKTIA